MATMLLCRRVIAWPKLYRPLCEASSKMAVSCGQVERQVPSQRPSRKDNGGLPPVDELVADWHESLRRDKDLRAYSEKYRGREPPWSPVLIFKEKGDRPKCWFLYFCVLGDRPPEMIFCNRYLESTSFHPDNPNWSQPFIARSFVAQLILLGATPDLFTFTILIEFYCKDPNMKYEHILDVVFTQMKALGIKADKYFCKTVMNAVCARFGRDVGFQLLKRLRSSQGIEMCPSCYFRLKKLVVGFCKRKMTGPRKMYMRQEWQDIK